jgi:P-type conjugative transfer protein TrbJ
LIAEYGADLGFVSATLDTLKKIYALDKTMKEDDDKRYEADHKKIEEHVFEDRTDEVRGLLDLLDSQGALSFVKTDFDEKYKAQNPGYRQSAADSYIDFASDYKDRADKLQSYMGSAMWVNNSAAKEISASLETIKELKRASENAYGYRQLWQAGAQVMNFVNQELSETRLDIGRQFDVEARYAINEQQEKTDAAASFGQAVRNWKTQSGGAQY